MMITRLSLVSAAIAATLFAQPAPPAAGRGGGGRSNTPVSGSASVRPTGSSLGTIRLGAADEKIWFGWKVGVAAATFVDLTWSEAAAKSDALGLGSVEGFDTQRVSYEIPKPLDYHLQAGEQTAVRNRLIELNLKMAAYHVASFANDAATLRKQFEFAKTMGVETIIGSPDAARLGEIESLANELGINVAIESRTDPKPLLSSIAARGKHIGISGDTSRWIENGVKPAEAADTAKSRLMAVTIRGSADLSAFFLAAFRDGAKPLFIAVDSEGSADPYADLVRCLGFFEKSMLPAMTARVAQVVDSPEGKIRGPELLSDDMKKQIEAAVPHQPPAKPKKARKLLVVDLQMYSGHSSIPHGNYMLELMAKYTGAFTPTFSNDLSNLKYPKIAQYDAVYLNNVCGMTFPDPEVRTSLLRFVREGGGIGGHHAVTFSNLDWPEFAEMMGMWSGAHHTEPQWIKVDDPSSPINAAFGGKSFEHTDEFYHMPMNSPYSREKQHVLLSLDVSKSDMATGGRFCKECTRPDQDYALSWIKTYGKGRVFCTPLGHTTVFYTSPQWEQHMLAAIQYILGDLDADATPSAKSKSK